MAEAKRDGNSVTTLIGVSSVDSVTPTLVAVNPVNGRMLVDLPGGSTGTVTDVSVVSANGFAGSVATSTTTPAITLSTTITGILSGNGTAISAASTTGSGSVVLATSPTLVTPILGTPTSGTLTNTTGFPTANLAGAGAGVLTFLATPSSANLATAVTGETGTGALVFATSPGFTTAANPVSNDGAALGTTALQWSDAFLASGALIDFANNNSRITHSSGILTVSTGELRITSANVGTNADSVPTLSSTSTFTNKTLTSPSITSPTVTTTWNFGANTAYFTETDNGNSSTADTINWGVSNKQKSTLTGNVTYTFTAPAGPCSLLLKVIQGSGPYTITWPATVHWSGGTAPTLTTTNGRVDIITFYYDGTTYFGNSSLNYVA